MKRRAFIAGLGAAALPLATRAQQRDPIRRIGALIPGVESDSNGQLLKTTFEQGLLKLGWVNTRNVRIEYRWGAGDIQRIDTLAAELVVLRPDVLFAGATPELAALRQATRSIPIVFAWVSDPVGSGFVASMARPGGNITGFIPVEPPLAGKWVELLKEAAPNIRRMAFLYHPETAYAQAFMRFAEAAAGAHGVKLIAAPARNEMEIDNALTSLASEPNGGLIVLTDEFANVNRERIIDISVRHRLPAVSGIRSFVNRGGLISYGNDLNDDYRLAAGYVDRILRGEKPADLPVQAPVRFELIVNLKTAEAIGLTIPETFLARANRVIE